ncbi:unnamed protein product, partial [Nesidiocoris tenuis]
QKKVQCFVPILDFRKITILPFTLSDTVKTMGHTYGQPSTSGTLRDVSNWFLTPSVIGACMSVIAKFKKNDVFSSPWMTRRISVIKPARGARAPLLLPVAAPDNFRKSLVGREERGREERGHWPNGQMDPYIEKRISIIPIYRSSIIDDNISHKLSEHGDAKAANCLTLSPSASSGVAVASATSILATSSIRVLHFPLTASYRAISRLRGRIRRIETVLSDESIEVFIVAKILTATTTTTKTKASTTTTTAVSSSITAIAITTITKTTSTSTAATISTTTTITTTA